MKKLVLLTLFFNTTCFVAFGQYTNLLSFAGVVNGKYPYGSLVSDGTFLYGMTCAGGSNGIGNLFKIMPDGSGYSNLLNFTGATNGKNPFGSLISDGTYLYGMTEKGGANDSGVVFKILPNGTGYTKLFEFAGNTDGSYPDGDLFYDGTFLYGTTAKGGNYNMGTIFKIRSDGSGYSKIFDFSGANGNYPIGSLISDGTFLYGMTSIGGTNYDGTIFKIMPNGTGYSTLLNFSGADGRTPNGSLFYDGTFLYGMTSQGGTSDNGIVFKIMPNGTGYSNLLNFTCTTNGCNPQGSLISDGTFLYGLTRDGGSCNDGTLFKIMPDGTGYSNLMDFCFTNGMFPNGSLISDGTFFYGMTVNGGTNNLGTIFKFGIPNGITEISSENNFSIYPNPSNGIFRLNAEITSGEIFVYNTMGEIIFQSKIENRQSTINLADQPNGIYFATIRTETNSFTQKIIIDK
jgi:uncharacterized repeat protein (TIGR03803 family)